MYFPILRQFGFRAKNKTFKSQNTLHLRCAKTFLILENYKTHLGTLKFNFGYSACDADTARHVRIYAWHAFNNGFVAFVKHKNVIFCIIHFIASYHSLFMQSWPVGNFSNHLLSGIEQFHFPSNHTFTFSSLENNVI